MSLKITKVENNASSVQEEYVRIDVESGANLKGYALLDNTYDESGKTSNVHRHLFEFPKITVQKNDIIYVYTGTGAYKPVARDGYTIHNFYCNSEDFIWNKTGDFARLVRILSVQLPFKVPAKK